MSCVSAETSQKIKNMSIVCALFVVTIHVSWARESVCLTWLINELVAQGIARIAVPFFFVISGYFLAAHFDEEGWWSHETKKRVRSLVVPFFLWNILAFLMYLPQSLLKDYVEQEPIGSYITQNWLWTRVLGFDLSTTPLDGPTWYMRCLFFFVLLSPLFKIGIRRLRIGWILFAFFVARIPRFLLNDPESFWTGFFNLGGLSLGDIFYFFVGIYLRDFKIQIRSKPLFVVCAVYSIGFLVARTILHAYGMETPFGIGSLFLPAMMYVIWYVMPSCSLPKWLASCSFPVYVLHIIILRPVVAVLKRCPLDAQIKSILACIIGIVASIIVTNLLRKYLPRVSNFLFAGRA